ncbi:hypothetical protein CHCC14821_3466 [Bacillus paralicheniformis]|nr:hypothetical protein CHCC14821_3466 [Bacillus paralicheniformis]
MIQSLRRLKDDDIKSTAAGLIAEEENEKYQKKYKTVWKNT